MTTIEIFSNGINKEFKIRSIYIGRPIREANPFLRSIHGNIVPHDIEIKIDFIGELPDLIRKFAVLGKIIDQMIVRVENNPVIIFLYVVIDKIDAVIKTGYQEIHTIHMKALRILDSNKPDYQKSRHCIECGRTLNYWHVHSLMSRYLKDEVINNIWDNDELFNFHCCYCYKRFRNLNKESNLDNVVQYTSW